MENHPIIGKLSIVIPAYNEGKTIHRILDKVRDVELPYNIEKEVIIINDCSKDDTEEEIRHEEEEWLYEWDLQGSDSPWNKTTIASGEEDNRCE